VSLTEALAVLGGLVLAVVVAHGAWSTRRARPRRPDTQADRVDPDLGAHSERVIELEPKLVSPRSAGQLDALIDAIITLTLEAPLSAELVLAHWPATRRAGSKPYSIEGLETKTGQWETPRPGRRYTELQAGVLMANRNGALNEIEYSEFVQKVQAFGDAVGATADVPDMLDVVARSRELDAFAGPLDAQLALNLRARGASWSVAYLQQCAQRHGFVAGAVPGRLVLPGTDDGAPPVLVLAFDASAALAENPSDAAVRDVALSLDVPQTPAEQEPFQAWHRVATALSKEMDADMVDDAGVPLKLQAFPAIGQDILGLYGALASRDLAAGSAAARRLFSG
jgi:ZipA, C-terminal FtsZ-binding domain